ncbi:MAG: hypothetical protein M1834_002065 [Cirrosporium novae-zelandiae]|nr:MAG: hypothetical protein M1834_002065 [Cirrosporium novae-zelandiae]
MDELIKEYHQDIVQIERSGKLDPYNLAAKYCHAFVNIHPFLDGNGRTCRLIMNAILLKYVGIVVPLGEHDTERLKYLEIARRGGETLEHGELGTMVLEKSMKVTRKLKQKLRSSSQGKQ